MRAYVEESTKPHTIWTSPQGALATPRSTYAMHLALRAAVEFLSTGRVISPEEAGTKDLAWYADVFLQVDWIQFHKDQLTPQLSPNGHKDAF